MFGELQSTALAGVETAVNQALQYDPATRLAIEELEGKVLAIESTLPPLSFYILHNQGSILLRSEYDDEPDTRLKGSAIDLLSVAVGGLTSDAPSRSSFFGTGVEMHGDSALLSRVQTILKNLEVDWEAALATLIGDVPAHLIGKQLRAFKHWQSDATNRASDVITGFQQEEVQLTPSRNECDAFYQDVQYLRKEVDRAEARLNRLSISLDEPPRQGG